MMRAIASYIVSRSVLLGTIAFATHYYSQPDHRMPGRLGGFQHQVSSALDEINRVLAASSF